MYTIDINGVYNSKGSEEKEGISEIYLSKVKDNGEEKELIHIGEEVWDR